ncbi:MAG TPA: sulfotransferase [Solirubrobacteraceae bacterium]|jgi:hypothetical protein|nr:sulfotransferase [Solirubrobacteraceae bacterium]
MTLSGQPRTDGSAAAGAEDEAPEERFERELAAACAEHRRRPDFFVVGHAKCGTTALYGMLEQHPQIYMSAVKEPRFLSRALDEPLDCERARSLHGPGKRPQTLEAYLALFADALPQQSAGEASPQYIRSQSAPRRIAALCPDARIVAIFREPVSFLRSLHLQLLEAGIETEPDFAAALALEPERRNGRHIPRDCVEPDRLLYSEHVRYTLQLRRFHERFGRERVLALIYDDFRSDNHATVAEVFRFLGVEDSFQIRAADANPTVRVRSPRAHDLVHGAALGDGPILQGVKRVLKATTPARLRRRAVREISRKLVDREPGPADPALVLELQRRFKDEVVAASEYLDRDLVSLWGYDALARPSDPAGA